MNELLQSSARTVSNLPPFDIVVPDGASESDTLASVTNTDKDVMSDFMSLVPKKEAVAPDAFLSLVPKKENVSVTPEQPETLSKKLIRGALGVLDTPEEITNRLVKPFTENIAGQATGLVDLASKAAFGTRGYVQNLIATGSPEKAWETAKTEAENAPQINYQPTTELGRKSLEASGKVIGVVGELGKGAVQPILETTKAPKYIKEPVEAVTEFASYLLLPKTFKSATRTTKLVENIVEKNVDPLYLRDHLIKEGVNPLVAVEAERMVRQRGLTASVAERSLVESDRPYVAKAKEIFNIEPGVDKTIANLESVTKGVKLGDEVRPYTAEQGGVPQLESPAPLGPRPMGGDERLALPPGEAFITDHASINAPLTPTSPFATTGRKQIEQKKDFVVVPPKEGQRQLPFEPGEIVGRGTKEGEGFTVENAPINTTPQLNWQGKPFKTEASAEKSALKAGVAADSFEVIPSGKGFAYRLLDTRPRPIDTTGQVTEPIIKTTTVPTEEVSVPEVSKSDIMAGPVEQEIAVPEKEKLPYLTKEEFDSKYQLAPGIEKVYDLSTPRGQRKAVDFLQSVSDKESRPIMDEIASLMDRGIFKYEDYAAEMKPKVVSETPPVDTTSVLEKLLGLEESKKVLELDKKIDKLDVKGEYAVFIKERLKKLPKELKGFVVDNATADQLTNMAGMKLNTLAVAKPTTDINKFYRPAVRLQSGEILFHSKALHHADALALGLTKLGIDPKTFNYSLIEGTGGVGPDGNYYEDTHLGDVPTVGENIEDYVSDYGYLIRPEKRFRPETGIVEGSGLLFSDGTSEKLVGGHNKVEKTPDTLRTSTTDKEVVIDLTLGIDPTPAQLDAIEGMIGKRRDVRIGVYKPSGKYMTGGVVESPKDVMRFVNEAKGKTFPPEGTDGTILNSGFDPIAAVNSLKATVEDVASLLPHLENLGKYTYEKGKTKYFEWQKEIKSLLGDMWEKFKSYIADVWKRVSSGKVGVLKNQRGSVGPEEPIAKKRVTHLSDKTRALRDMGRLREKLKKAHETMTGDKLTRRVENLEKLIAKANDKAMKTKDVTDTYAPEVSTKTFNTLKTLPDMRKGMLSIDTEAETGTKSLVPNPLGKPLGGHFETMLGKIEDWVKDLGESAQYWAKEKFYYDIRTADDTAFKLYKKENAAVAKLRDEFPVMQRNKVSERIHTYAIAQEPKHPRTGKTGLETLKDAGITEIPKLISKEMEAYKYLLGKLKEYGPLINEGRVKAGLQPFGILNNYFTHARDFSFSDLMGIGFKDSEHTSPYIHPKSTAFPGAKHRTRSEIPLVLDAFGVVDRYIHAGVRHMFLSPAIAAARELTGKFEYKDKDGKAKTWDMKDKLPTAYKELTEYLDTVSGKMLDGAIPPWANMLMHGLAKNSNIAALAGSIPSVLIQPTAIVNTYSKFGLPYTVRGVMGLFTKARIEAMQESEHLASRLQDIDIVSMAQGAVGKIGRIKEKAVNSLILGLKALKFWDEEMATAARITAKLYYSEVEGLTGEKLKRYSDDFVVKGHGSAAAYDISPVQRYQLGKFITNLQTFVIADYNFKMRETLGIKNPRISKKTAMKYIIRLIIGTTVINTLYELAGKDSPLPAPITAMIKKRKEIEKAENTNRDNETKRMSEFRKGVQVGGAGALEFTKNIPVVGGLKYGSSIMGLPIDTLTEVSKKVAKEFGKGSGSYKSWLELGGRVAGVPRTAQTAREINILTKAYEKSGELNAGDFIDALIGAYPEEEDKKGPTLNSLRNLRQGPKLNTLKKY